MKCLFVFALILPLLAEDIPPPKPTVEELTAQVAAKDQEIVALKHQLTEAGRDVSLYRQNFNACVDKVQGDQQKPALNPAQRMMQRGPKPAEAKPEGEPSK